MNKELLDKIYELISEMEKRGQQVPPRLKKLPKIIETSMSVGWDNLTQKYYKELKEKLEEYGIYENNELPKDIIPDDLKNLLISELNKV